MISRVCRVVACRVLRDFALLMIVSHLLRDVSVVGYSSGGVVRISDFLSRFGCRNVPSRVLQCVSPVVSVCSLASDCM